MCEHRYVSNERNRRAAIWSGFRFNPRFVRLPNASADAVLCQLSSTVDPFGFLFLFFLKFSEWEWIETPIEFPGYLRLNGSHHIRRHVSRTRKCPDCSSSALLFQEKKRNKCVAVWPEKERELDRCLLFHPNCCALWPRKEKVAECLVFNRTQHSNRTTDGLKNLFCRANWPKTHGC